MPSFGVAIVTYNGPLRVSALLDSLRPNREAVDQIVIFEDPSYPEVSRRLAALAKEHGVAHKVRPEWGCMQGNAAFAMQNMDTDIVCLLSDDILLTPTCLADHRKVWERYWFYPIACAQIPYWGNWSDLINLGLTQTQDAFYSEWPNYIKRIPRNKFWDHDGYPRLYVNVHGSGFSLRRDVYRSVGGFSPQHWSYDEDIAARIWLKSPCVVVAVPGSPFVHFGGASQCGNEHPDTQYHTLDAWIEAWGADKSAIHAQIRERMNERAYIDGYFRRS